jgi:hypothetical protein
MLPLDLMPHGLRKVVGPKVTTVGGRDLLRHMLHEFDNAVEHAAEEAKRTAKGGKDQAASPPVGEAANPSGP